MDIDCLICFEPHSTEDCPERKPQNCPRCHVFIKNFSDHSTLCDLKTWVFKPFPGIYAKPPVERLIVGCNKPIRFFLGGIWKKPSDSEEMFSAESGILVRFKNESDFAILTGKFAPIRIALVVKEGSKFFVKLMLLASQKRFIVATNVHQLFDRNTAAKSHTRKTTLIVAVSSTDNLCFDIMTLRPNELANRHELRYDETNKKFLIPEELDMDLPWSENQTVNREPNNQMVLAQVKYVKQIRHNGVYFE